MMVGSVAGLASWPVSGAANLAVRVLAGRIDVTLPAAVQFSETLGLFFDDALKSFESPNDGQAPAASLACTSAAVDWRCLNETTAHDERRVVSLAHPEWRGRYVVMLVSGDCHASAASAAFIAGPSPNESDARIEIVQDGGAASEPCSEAPWLDVRCPAMTVTVSGRGPKALRDDAIVFLPLWATTLNAWRSRLAKFSVADASPAMVLGTTRANASLRVQAPLGRGAYVVALLRRNDLLSLLQVAHNVSHVVAVSDVLLTGAVSFKDFARTSSTGAVRGASLHVEQADAGATHQPLTPSESEPLSLSVTLSRTAGDSAAADASRHRLNDSESATDSYFFMPASFVNLGVVVQIMPYVHFANMSIPCETYAPFSLSSWMRILGRGYTAPTTPAEAEMRPFITRLGRAAIVDGDVVASFLYDMYTMYTIATLGLDPTIRVGYVPSDASLPIVRSVPVHHSGANLWGMWATHNIYRYNRDQWTHTIDGLVLSLPFATLPMAAACQVPSPIAAASALSICSNDCMRRTIVSATVALAGVLLCMLAALTCFSRWWRRSKEPLGRAHLCLKEITLEEPSSTVPDMTTLPAVPKMPLIKQAELQLRATHKLGEGAHAHVYLGTWQGCAVALKVFKRCSVTTPHGHGAVKQFTETTGTATITEGKAAGGDCSTTVGNRTALLVHSAADGSWPPNSSHSFALSIGLTPANTSIGSSALAKRVAAEVAVLSRLRHPCICAFYGTSNMEGELLLVLEYLSGGTLWHLLHHEQSHERLNLEPRPEQMSQEEQPPPPPPPQQQQQQQQQPRLPLPLLSRIAQQSASGLCYLHTNDLMHRDVKSTNILLTSDLHAKVADFGLTTHAAVATSRCGTLRYMAPEVALGTQYDRACDVYSFGILLWEIMHVARPFENEPHDMAVVYAVSQGRRPTIALPAPRTVFEPIIAKCWAHVPKSRPSMEEVLEELMKQELCSLADAPLTVPGAPSAVGHRACPALHSPPPSLPPGPPSTVSGGASTGHVLEVELGGHCASWVSDHALRERWDDAPQGSDVDDAAAALASAASTAEAHVNAAAIKAYALAASKDDSVAITNSTSSSASSAASVYSSRAASLTTEEIRPSNDDQLPHPSNGRPGFTTDDLMQLLETSNYLPPRLLPPGQLPNTSRLPPSLRPSGQACVRPTVDPAAAETAAVEPAALVPPAVAGLPTNLPIGQSAADEYARQRARQASAEEHAHAVAEADLCEMYGEGNYCKRKSFASPRVLQHCAEAPSFVTTRSPDAYEGVALSYERVAHPYVVAPACALPPTASVVSAKGVLRPSPHDRAFDALGLHHHANDVCHHHAATTSSTAATAPLAAGAIPIVGFGQQGDVMRLNRFFVGPDVVLLPPSPLPSAEGSSFGTCADFSGAISSTSSVATAGERKRIDWTEEEDKILRESVAQHGCRWRMIARVLRGKSDDAVRNRWNRLNGLVSPAASPSKRRATDNAPRYAPRWEEDLLLTGEKKTKQEHLPWSTPEDETILRCVAELGHKWSLIAERLPGRTDHAIRNRLHRLQSNGPSPKANRQAGA